MVKGYDGITHITTINKDTRQEDETTERSYSVYKNIEYLYNKCNENFDNNIFNELKETYNFFELEGMRYFKDFPSGILFEEKFKDNNIFTWSNAITTLVREVRNNEFNQFLADVLGSDSEEDTKEDILLTEEQIENIRELKKN